MWGWSAIEFSAWLILAVVWTLAVYAQGYRDGRAETRIRLSKPARRIAERE